MSKFAKYTVAAFAFALAFAMASHASAVTVPPNVSMTSGSSAQVMDVQTALNAAGASPVLAVDGKFGPMTKAAVMAYQSAHGLTADGVVGPMTAASLNSMTGGAACPTGYTCTTTTPVVCPAGYTCTPVGGTATGTLTGGAGSLDDVQEDSSYSGEQVVEGDEDTTVAAFEVQADDGSDLQILAMDLMFSLSSGSGSDNMNDYFDSISIWMGDTEVASADESSFSDDDDGADTGSGDDYQKTLSLNSSAIVGAGDTETFYVKVTATNNIDSTDLDHNNWQVNLNSIRFKDATGAVVTDSTTGDLPATVDFEFDSLSAAGDVELHASLNNDDDEINDSHVVEVDDTANTNDVELLSFQIEATGDIQDIKDIPIVVKSTNSNSNAIASIASSFSLWMDGTKIDTVDVSDGTADDYDSGVTEDAACDSTSNLACAIHFDDINFDLDDGDTANFVVKANINDIDAGNFDEGDDLLAELTATAFDAADASDQNGDDVGTSDLTGSAIGESIYFYTTVFTFDLGSRSAAITTVGDASATTPTSDIGTFTINFDLTAFGDDISIDQSCTEAQTDTPDQGVEYTITNAGSNDTTCSVSSTADTNPDDSGAWIIYEGQTESFTLTVAATATADHFAKVYLTSINWDDDTTDTSPDQYFSSGLGIDTTSTAEIYLNDN